MDQMYVVRCVDKVRFLDQYYVIYYVKYLCTYLYKIRMNKYIIIM